MEGTTAILYLKDIITADMLSGVFNELVGVLPVVIPFSVSCMGVRKGLKFLFSCLRSA